MTDRDIFDGQCWHVQEQGFAKQTPITMAYLAKAEAIFVWSKETSTEKAVAGTKSAVFELSVDPKESVLVINDPELWTCMCALVNGNDKHVHEKTREKMAAFKAAGCQMFFFRDRYTAYGLPEGIIWHPGPVVTDVQEIYTIGRF